MGKLNEHLTRLYVAMVAPPRTRDDRGDVPGWVLVTVMSAGIVMVVWAVAEEQLSSMLTKALNKVK